MSYVSIKENSNHYKSDDKSGILELEKNLLWKLHLERKDAFEAMNNDVEVIVNQCLAAKRHLQAVEDSNRKLQQEVRVIRSKYEALLAKNRKDTGIIMRLKDSETLLKQALKNKNTASESLNEVQLNYKEKTLQRKLLQDDRDKLVFRSQVITNNLKSKNMKHKYLYEQIKDENRKYQDNDEQFIKETEYLKYILSKNDNILEKWLKNNAERDAAIRRLQDNMKNSFMLYLENDEEGAADETDVGDVDILSGKQKNSELNEERNNYSKPDDASYPTLKNNESSQGQDVTFKKEWMSKKTLFEVAEKQKEHLTDFYVLLNKRMQDLSNETVNVWECLIGKEAEKTEILEKASAMEKIVSEKRRQKPIFPRKSTDEMNIWIEVQQEANDALRKLAYKCMSVKLIDSAIYSEFEKVIRAMYLDSLKEQIALDSEKEESASEEKQDT